MSTSISNELDKSKLEEIIVTAQKRVERLQDVPMSLTSLSGEELVRSQSFQFEDYVGKVPGLNLIDFGALGSQLVLRGITTGSGAINSSVATYIDETPYGGVGPYAETVLIAPNLDTFDMQRIEVLRGPQGTLYGANALGGLLKYVTNAPDPSGFEAKVEAGVSSVDSGRTGFDTHAMVNVPLASDIALRLVGYDNYYPGFIDDPSRGLSDINGYRFIGGRASLLYIPTTDLSIRFNALYQDKPWDDWGNEDVSPGTLRPIYGNLIQEHLLSQPGHTITELYNVTANWNVGFANFLSTTSYANYERRSISDYGNEYGPYVSYLLGGTYGVALQQIQPVRAITQEVRLSSSGDRPLQWQVGGFFTNENASEFQGLFPVDVATKTILFNYPTNVAAFYIPVRYREYAGFIDMDYYITPTVEVGIGGRHSDNSQSFHETGLGLLGGGADYGVESSQGVFTYSGDVRWHVTSESMLYARIAEGFAPGGPNDAIPTATVPHTYSSSTTINYEIGVKSRLLDDHLTVEVSAFDVDWRKIQLAATIGGFGTTTNGGTAQSRGAEWTLAYVPIRGLTLNVNGAYTDARLTEATPASVNGHVGDRLPAVPLFESSAGAKYERPLFGEYSGFAGVDYRFTGNRYADFSATGPRQKMPSFNIFDLRTGVQSRSWSCTLYVKNVGNKLAINYVQPETLNGGSGPQSATVYAPRTIGAALAVKF